MIKVEPKYVMLGISGTILITYIGSYFVLSRRGYAEADRYGSEGFYYFTPENTDGWRFHNEACVSFFWPLNFVDRLLGTGRFPSFEPMWLEYEAQHTDAGSVRHVALNAPIGNDGKRPFADGPGDPSYDDLTFFMRRRLCAYSVDQ